MSSSESSVESLVNREYQYGFVTDIESDTIPRGLSEDVVRLISAKKQEPAWMLEWRLKAYRRWLEMKEPHHWANITYPPIDYQDVIYYSAPKSAKPLGSLDEVDPELLKTYEKLGIPLTEQKLLAGVAVDAIFDSVSVATTFKDDPGQVGRHLLLHERGGAGAPRAGAAVPGLGGAVQRQLLRGAQLGGVQRRLLRVRPEGRPLPDGALHLLPHQHGGRRPVRADPDRGRRRRLR